MSTGALIKNVGSVPALFDDFFRPWNEWLDSSGLMGKTMNMPAVNIIENKDDFLVSLAVPGMKKDDFNVDVEGNILTICCEKEEKKDEKETRFTGKEYTILLSAAVLHYRKTLTGKKLMRIMKKVY